MAGFLGDVTSCSWDLAATFKQRFATLAFDVPEHAACWDDGGGFAQPLRAGYGWLVLWTFCWWRELKASRCLSDGRVWLTRCCAAVFSLCLLLPPLTPAWRGMIHQAVLTALCHYPALPVPHGSAGESNLLLYLLLYTMQYIG
jgi:hypothetical protein